MTNSALLFPACLFLMGASLCHLGILNGRRIQAKARDAQSESTPLTTWQTVNLRAPAAGVFRVARVSFLVLSALLFVATFTH
jgi:hypothetical protein